MSDYYVEHMYRISTAYTWLSVLQMTLLKVAVFIRS